MSTLNSEIAGWIGPAIPAVDARRRAWRRWGGPALLVLAAAASLLLVTGVPPGDLALFAGYHALFVIAPGWVTYRLLRPADGARPRQLVFGWALGYVLEVLVFAGTAALGERHWMTWYPLAVFALGAALWRPRVRSARVTVTSLDLPKGWGWAVAAVCVLALGLVGLEYFGSAPLPGQVSRVSYGIDTVWYLSLAAEALHHWPVSDPTVSGQPLYYHLFSSFDPAAISQVTGIDLPVVFLRLYVVPMVVLFVLALSVVGASIGSGWSGPIAAGLVLFVGELNLDPHLGYKFANELGDDVLAISPSFLMGAILFVPLVGVLCELVRSPRLRGLPWGMLALFALLAVGSAGAKAPIPTVLGGGLILFLVWHAVTRRRIHWPVLAAFAVVGIVFAWFWAFSYGGAGSDQMVLSPPGVIRQMDVTSYFAALVGAPGTWSALLWGALTIVGVVGAYGAQLVGLAAGRPRRSRDVLALLLAIFVFGQLPYLLYTHPGLSQVFFSEYGVIAASLVSAEGLRALWVRTERRRALSLFAAACAGCSVIVSLALPSLLGLHGNAGRELYLYIDAGLACALIASFAVLQRTGARRAGRLAFVAAGVLAVGLVGRTLTIAAPTASLLARDRPLYSQTGPGMTAGLYDALAWINERTSPSAVVAVNNFRDWSLYWSDGWAVPDDFNYSAFAERPVFLEGWIYTQAAAEASDATYYGGQLLFPRRVALNNEIFQWAHAAALRTVAQQYGVRYLLVDRVHNRANPNLAHIAHLVYYNRDAAVYLVPRSDLILASARRHPQAARLARASARGRGRSRERRAARA